MVTRHALDVETLGSSPSSPARYHTVSGQPKKVSEPRSVSGNFKLETHPLASHLLIFVSIRNYLDVFGNIR